MKHPRHPRHPRHPSHAEGGRFRLGASLVIASSGGMASAALVWTAAPDQSERTSYLDPDGHLSRQTGVARLWPWGRWQSPIHGPSRSNSLPAMDMAPQHAPIDQGVADRGALSTSLRSFSADLAVPGGFQQVFGLPDRPDGEKRLYRAQGAIHAVYSEAASYTRRGGRPIALVPAGTVFHIGSPLEDVPGTAEVGGRYGLEQRLSMRVDARVFDRLDERIEAERGVVRGNHVASSTPSSDATAESVSQDAASVPLPEFVRDEAYRRDRLRSVLDATAR